MNQISIGEINIHADVRGWCLVANQQPLMPLELLIESGERTISTQTFMGLNGVG